MSLPASRLIVAALLGVVLSLAGAIAYYTSAGKAGTTKPEAAARETTQFGSAGPWSKGYLPNSILINQDGKQVHFYDDVVKDKIAVFSFIYTSCRNICPLVTSRLAEVQAKLAEAQVKDVIFVSISIDPIPDTPEKLKAYASAFKVKDNWVFLTGDPAVVDEIRYRLGERSGTVITNHKNDILLYNDRNGEWARDSAMGDIDLLALTIHNMDPEWRAGSHPLPDGFAAAPPTPVKEVSGHDVPGQALFIKACASCHTIGNGDKVGPDLAGVGERRTREWLAAYLSAPEKLRAANDPIALELRDRFGAVRMPNLGLAETDVADLASYIAARSRKPETAAQDAPASKAPEPK